jgi:hypothetical protein
VALFTACTFYVLASLLTAGASIDSAGLVSGRVTLVASGELVTSEISFFVTSLDFNFAFNSAMAEFSLTSAYLVPLVI